MARNLRPRKQGEAKPVAVKPVIAKKNEVDGSLRMQAFTREALQGLQRREIQALAKASGVAANLKTETIIERLVEKHAPTALPAADNLAKESASTVAVTVDPRPRPTKRPRITTEQGSGPVVQAPANEGKPDSQSRITRARNSLQQQQLRQERQNHISIAALCKPVTPENKNTSFALQEPPVDPNITSSSSSDEGDDLPHLGRQTPLRSRLRRSANAPSLSTRNRDSPEPGDSPIAVPERLPDGRTPHISHNARISNRFNSSTSPSGVPERLPGGRTPHISRNNRVSVRLSDGRTPHISRIPSISGVLDRSPPRSLRGVVHVPEESESDVEGSVRIDPIEGEGIADGHPVPITSPSAKISDDQLKVGATNKEVRAVRRELAKMVNEAVELDTEIEREELLIKALQKDIRKMGKRTKKIVATSKAIDEEIGYVYKARHFAWDGSGFMNREDEIRWRDWFDDDMRHPVEDQDEEDEGEIDIKQRGEGAVEIEVVEEHRSAGQKRPREEEDDEDDFYV